MPRGFPVYKAGSIFASHYSSMDLTLTAASIALGLISHFFFNRYEPRSANSALPVLALLPPLLLVAMQVSLALRTVLFTYTIFLMTLTTSIAVYRISPFHPLAAYPGPTICKITKLWSVGIAATGYQYRYLKTLHDTYGPYVRTGPNELSVVDAKMVGEILGSGGLQKGRYYESGRHESTPPSIVSLSGEAHAAQRRVWSRALTSAAIREYEPALVKRAKQLVACIDAERRAHDGVVDVVKWVDLFALDLMGDLSFGGGFEGMKTGNVEHGQLIRSFMAYANHDPTCLFNVPYDSAAHIPGHIPWILPTLHILPGVGRMIQDFNDFGHALATQRVKNGSPGGAKDLWYHLADEAGTEKERPSLARSASDGIVAIVAASDTAAAVMSSFMWRLLQEPEVYALIREELDRVFADVAMDDLDALCEEDKQQELVYLCACINETLRLHPPVPTNGTRQVHLDEPARLLAGRLIPPGTSIYTPAYALHRQPTYFPFPDAFRPARWLPPTHDPAAFIPFSLGPANCVGQKFARHEMLLVLSMLLHVFDFAVAGVGAEGELGRWIDSVHDHFVTSRGPLRVRVTLRGNV
ncbi:hypothetical protein MKEN_01156800 [Mycena kentingensis (nom. inval.)]|nr:hypothetical protein MKEN_01156800 [Mycena kentingensis (nom. inval.)]